LWYPATPPHVEYWSNSQGHSLVIPSANSTSLEGGEDNSKRRTWESAGAYVVAYASLGYGVGAAGNGIVYMCWVKPYDFASTQVYQNGWVDLITHHTYGYGSHFAYFTDAPWNVGWQRMLMYARLDVYQQAINGIAVMPLDEWIHLAMNVRLDYSNVVDFYVNGEPAGQGSTDLRPDLVWDVPINTPIYLGGNVWNLPYGGLSSYGNNTTKDYRIYIGQLSAEEVRECYRHSLGFHRSTSGLIDTSLRAVRVEYTPDPTHVPDEYVANNSLSWAQRATHIWAIHPSHPLKADKGGFTLELVNPAGGNVPTIVPSPENTMRLHGGSHNYSGFYRTINTFIWGDDPLTAGNQTPPAIGAMSCWVKVIAPVSYTGFLGGENTDGTISYMAPHLVLNSANTMFGLVNGLTVAGTPPVNTWVHVCLTNDATYRRVYINGVKTGESAQDSVAMGDFRFRVGSNMWGGISDANLILDGEIRLAAVVNGSIWTEAEILEQYQRPYAYYGPVPETLGLDAETGHFGLSGQAATLRADRRLTAGTGSFIEVGQPASLRADRILSAGAGAYNLTGWEAILTYGRKLFGETGVFALDGQPVDMRTARILQAGGGVFLITGQDAILKHWMPVQASGRIFYVAKDDRIVYISSDIDIREGE
jgi:hypothetical protein